MKLLTVVVLATLATACADSQGKAVSTEQVVSHVVCVDANNVVVDSSKCEAATTAATTTTRNNGMPVWFWYYMYTNSLARPGIGSHVSGGSTYPKRPTSSVSERFGATSRSAFSRPSTSTSYRPRSTSRPATSAARPTFRAPSAVRPSRLMGGRR